MTSSTHTIELPVDTYKRLSAVAVEQDLAIDALIERFLQSIDRPQKKTHRFGYLLDIAEDMEVDDLAENHDAYFHGADKS